MSVVSDILSPRDTMKVEPSETTSLKNSLNPVGYSAAFPNSAMFTPTTSHILMATQLMASGLAGIPPNPAFFDPRLFSAWTPSSPPSPPNSSERMSPALKARKHNNNNVVSRLFLFKNHYSL